MIRYGVMHMNKYYEQKSFCLCRENGTTKTTLVGESAASDGYKGQPAWGWPGFILASGANRCDFPTRVGMAR